MKKSLFLMTIWLALFSYNAYSQTVRKQNIFTAMETPDSATAAKVVFFQDEKIETMLEQKNVTTSTGVFFRVQAFSSNNQKNAKSEAFNVEKLLREHFPSEDIQVNYSAPSWKVRIGEFLNREDALAFQKQVSDALPAYKSQIYVIIERRSGKQQSTNL